MIKKITHNPIKLIKYYKFINHNLIYNNKAINRYKKDNFELSADKAGDLEKLKKSILDIKNCSLKNEATNMVFSDGNPKSKIMILGEAPGSNEDQEGLPFVGKQEIYLIKCWRQLIWIEKLFIYLTLLITVPKKIEGLQMKK